MNVSSGGRRVFGVAAALALAAVFSVCAAEPPAKLLPASSFFKNAEISGARLSPSGRYLAIRSGAKTERVLCFTDGCLRRMRGENERGIGFGEVLADDPPVVAHPRRIDMRERFIHDQHFRLRRERAGDGEP